jgi:hypothetical protein
MKAGVSCYVILSVSEESLESNSKRAGAGNEKGAVRFPAVPSG